MKDLNNGFMDPTDFRLMPFLIEENFNNMI